MKRRDSINRKLNQYVVVCVRSQHHPPFPAKTCDIGPRISHQMPLHGQTWTIDANTCFLMTLPTKQGVAEKEGRDKEKEKKRCKIVLRAEKQTVLILLLPTMIRITGSESGLSSSSI